MCIPESGHVEIYMNSTGRMELVKVTTSQHDAHEYLRAEVQDDDTVVFIQPNVPQRDVIRLTGTALKAALAGEGLHAELRTGCA